MPSLESIEIRKGIVRDAVPVGVSIEEERRQWEAYALTLALAEGTRLRQVSLAQVPCLWVEREGAEAERSVFYVHGGGLIAGSPSTHRELASRLAPALAARVLLVDFRLAPEAPFPAALADVEAAYRALCAEQAPGSVWLGADSSGAALGLALLVKLREGSVPLPAGAFFISGHFDLTLSGESLRSRAEVDPFTSAAALERASAWYAGGADRAAPLISPVFADLRGLPPLLLQVGSDEILLSDSQRVAARVRQQGGQAELHIWDGMWHTWPMYRELPEAAQALQELRRFVDEVQPIDELQA
jgi:acetyl esterase/lipase